MAWRSTASDLLAFSSLLRHPTDLRSRHSRTRQDRRTPRPTRSHSRPRWRTRAASRTTRACSPASRTRTSNQSSRTPAASPADSRTAPSRSTSPRTTREAPSASGPTASTRRRTRSRNSASIDRVRLPPPQKSRSSPRMFLPFTTHISLRDSPSRVPFIPSNSESTQKPYQQCHPTPIKYPFTHAVALNCPAPPTLASYQSFHRFRSIIRSFFSGLRGTVVLVFCRRFRKAQCQWLRVSLPRGPPNCCQ